MDAITATRLCVAVVVGAALVLPACGGKGGGTGGGRQPPDPRRCETGGNGVWTSSAGATVTIREPRSCPYAVASQGSPLSVLFYIDANFSFLGVGGVAVYTQIFDRNRVRRYEQNHYFTQNHPTDPAKLRAEIRGSYPAGYGSPPRDSADFSFIGSGGGVARGWAILPGNLAPSNSLDYLAGSDRPEINTSSTWYAVPEWDTISYEYQWSIDGVEQEGATAASLTWLFGVGGSHNISVTVKRTDYVNYTLHKPLWVTTPGQPDQ